MTKVRAKFICGAVTETTWGSKAVSMHATYSLDGENESFSKATPSGQLTLNVDKDTAAADFFVPGKAYYMEFSEAPKQ